MQGKDLLGASIGRSAWVVAVLPFQGGHVENAQPLVPWIGGKVLRLADLTTHYHHLPVTNEVAAVTPPSEGICVS